MLMNMDDYYALLDNFELRSIDTKAASVGILDQRVA